MLTAIYLFMCFSLVLTAGGGFYEFMRQQAELKKQQIAQQPSLAPIPPNAPDELWYDVLKATRQRLVGNVPWVEYNRGLLATGQSAELPIHLMGGECRTYIAMTKPPARIDISINNIPPNSVEHTPIGREGHFAFGRLCAAKSAEAPVTTLVVAMKSGDGPFVAETYRAQP